MFGTVKQTLYISPLSPCGIFTHHHKFYILPTQCVCVLCMYCRTNYNYSPIQY